MANWDELAADIWKLIFQKLIITISDHIPFSGVCKLWRSIGLEYRAMNFPTNVPALIIPGGTTTTSKTRRLLAFPVGKNIDTKEHDLPLPLAPHECLCRGSHQGWLVMVDKSMSMYLHNPINGGRISLPPVTSLPRLHPVDSLMNEWYVNKVILSKSPSCSPSDCFVLVFYGRGELALCRVGDKDWRSIEGPKSWGYIDGIFFRKEFYIVDNYGKIYVSDQLADSLCPKVKELAPQPPHWIPAKQNWYLVESGGDLYHILCKTEGQHNEVFEEEDGTGTENDDENTDASSEFDYHNEYDSDEVRNFTVKITQFKVFKLGTSTGSEPKWIEVEDLDGGAVFLGLNQSFALSKSNLMGHKGNRIYYTDDDIGGDKVYVCPGHDMGVFNLESSGFEILCLADFDSMKTPAIWITPTPW